jgi:phosphohistidine phosphatase
MKKVYLIRHGKSDWQDLTLDDIDRPLKDRGVANAEEMGHFMSEHGFVPTILMTSPAVRAYETAKILARSMDLTGGQFKTVQPLYLPDFSVLLKTLLYLDDHLGSAAIVGHEPSLSNLVAHFVGRPNEGVATASLTRLEFKVDHWRSISPDTLIKARYHDRHNMKGKDLTE